MHKFMLKFYLVLKSFEMTSDSTKIEFVNTVFPLTVSAEIIPFWKWKISFSFRIMTFFLLHKSNSCRGNYLRKYGRSELKTYFHMCILPYTFFGSWLPCKNGNQKYSMGKMPAKVSLFLDRSCAIFSWLITNLIMPWP